MKLSKLAESIGATVSHGSPDLEISGAAGLDLAGPDEITFLANPKYTPRLTSTQAGAVILADAAEVGRDDIAVLRASDPYLAYTRALCEFHPPKAAVPAIHPTAVIDPSSTIGEGCRIEANVVIEAGCSIGVGVWIHPNVSIYEGVSIGADCVIHSGVSIRENTVIGDRCTIHNNSTIGSDGFGYAKDEGKHWLKIPQVGRVVIEDDVEIGANTAIDRASVGETRVRRGAKIDNLVQIGHSCTVDEDALICSQTGLAGSSEVGKRVILAGQVGVAGHLKIGDDAVITAKSATSHDVEPGRVISGIPGFDNKEWLRATAAFRRIAGLAARVRELERRLETSQKAEGEPVAQNEKE